METITLKGAADAACGIRRTDCDWCSSRSLMRESSFVPMVDPSFARSSDLPKSSQKFKSFRYDLRTIYIKNQRIILFFLS